MSHPHGQGFPNPGEDMHAYYQALGIEWTGVNTPPYPYTDINQAYCSAPMAYPDTLTPVSLVDSSVGPSPAISNRSQEIHTQDYRYVNDPIIQPQGLGISAPFPSEYPRTTAPNQINYAYAPDHSHYNLGQTPGASPIAPPPKRMKRTPSKTPSRDTPVNILPHPEGMERMERARENRNSQPPPPIMPPKPRASGRSRRDPQADEEDAFVENLREKGYAWKIVRDMFCAHFNKDVTEARLQMRLKRRKNQRNQWDDADVSTTSDQRS